MKQGFLIASIFFLIGCGGSSDKSDNIDNTSNDTTTNQSTPDENSTETNSETSSSYTKTLISTHTKIGEEAKINGVLLNDNNALVVTSLEENLSVLITSSSALKTLAETNATVLMLQEGMSVKISDLVFSTEMNQTTDAKLTEAFSQKNDYIVSEFTVPQNPIAGTSFSLSFTLDAEEDAPELTQLGLFDNNLEKVETAYVQKEDNNTNRYVASIEAIPPKGELTLAYGEKGERGTLFNLKVITENLLTSPLEFPLSANDLNVSVNNPSLTFKGTANATLVLSYEYVGNNNKILRKTQQSKTEERTETFNNNGYVFLRVLLEGDGTTSFKMHQELHDENGDVLQVGEELSFEITKYTPEPTTTPSGGGSAPTGPTGGD